MTPLLAGKDASAETARVGEYTRHRREQTLLYQLLEAHYLAFVEHLGGTCAGVAGPCAARVQKAI